MEAFSGDKKRSFEGSAVLLQDIILLDFIIY